jgi:hypothetical protein
VSIEFEVRALPRKLGNFDDLLTLWQSRIDVPLITLQSAGEDYVWVFAPGRSIRGVSLRYERRFFRASIEMRLSVCASHGDWLLGASFLALAWEKGARVLEGERRLSLPDLLPDRIEKRARDQFRRDLGLLQRITEGTDDDHVTLPNQWFSFVVDRRDLTAEPEVIHDALARRTANYANARRASILTLKNGKTAIIWSGEELLAPRTDFIVFPSTRENADIDDYLYLEWQDVNAPEEIAGQMAAYYFRAVDDDDFWAPLIAKGRPISELSP